MRRCAGRSRLVLAAVSVTSILVGCALIFPARYERTSLLTPTPVTSTGEGSRYVVKEDGVVAYETEGLRIEVEYMTDRKLNEQFPQESTQGEYSTNPYTYGNYVDPTVGYVRNRFTVFKVTVYNLTHAKVELQPLRALVTTNRPGEVLQPYGIFAGSADGNFESYYRTRRGPSGNEYYRFNMRMGLVRSNNYRSEEKIFKGEHYGGFIAFDPLDDEVRSVTLSLRDFVLKFNAFDKPLETVDVRFDFGREVTIKEYEAETWLAASQVATRARLIQPSEVTGNVTGDITRDVTAIDAAVKTRLAEMARCFEAEFLAGTASEGEITVQYVILSHGGVEGVRVVSSTVVSQEVPKCLAAQIGAWRFRISGGQQAGPGSAAGEDTLSTQGAGQAVVPTSARVSVTSYLEFIDMRTEQ